MASAEYQHSILYRGPDPVKAGPQKGKHDATKRIARYRAGQAPKWAQEKQDEESDVDSDATPKPKEPPRRRPAATVDDAAISRLKRLVAAVPSAPVDRHERLRERHRAIDEAAVLHTEALRDGDGDDEDLPMKELKLEPGLVAPKLEGEEDDDEEDDPMADELRALRRERAREIALLKRKDEDENDLLKREGEDPIEEEDEDEDEEESEDGESSDEDDAGRAVMKKPVFVSKAQRETLKEKEAIEKEEELAEEKRKLALKERKVESKALLIDTIQQEADAERETAEMNDNSDIELIDDDDEKNEAEEYELWKIRELKRIKRDKEERLAREKELEEIEKRRHMTDQEREADNAKWDSVRPKREDTKSFGFMQKYYHRGAHFQDKAETGEEPIYLRDVHEPLASEQYDKNLLPKAMQLRRGLFGRSSQVKHSHLTAEDTTDTQAAWAQSSKPIQKYQEKMATASGVNSFDRPSGYKR